MNKQELNKLRMTNAWLSFMQKNKAKWENIEPIAQAYYRVFNLVEEIKETQKNIDNPNGGEQIQKEALQESVIVDGHEIVSYIFAYADAKENDKLKEKVGFSISSLRNLPDAKLAPKLNSVLDLIVGHEAEMVPYGVTQQKVENLKNLISQYEQQLPVTRNNLADQASGNDQIRIALKTAIDLLRNRVDKLMKRFEKDDPAFYAAHITNRKVIDYGKRYEKPDETEEKPVETVK